MSDARKTTHVWFFMLMALVLIVGSGVTVQAAKLYVANNGLDSATCGDKSTPCRSISQAIQNASPGDKIIVGPGRYGDLDADGTFGETGEEDAEVGFGCSCMIKVNKQLTIESRDGAAATVLDAGGFNTIVVTISASGVVFGKKKKGFTLTHAGAGGSGLDIAAGTNGVRVMGNLVTANSGDGFVFGGSGHVLTGNVVSANGFGGFSFGGSGHVLTGNVASANGFHGFAFSGSGHVLTGNVASANGFHGFQFHGSGHVLSGNSALGNKRFGFLILDFFSVDSATIIKNNLFGNNSQTVAGFTNCGLLNQSGDAFTVPNNFWGAATGPSATEPADNVCNSGTGSSTTVPSFATKEFKVRVKILEELPNESAVIEPSRLPVSEESFDLRLYTLAGQLLARASDETQLALAKKGLANGVYLAEKIYADGRREIVKVALRD
jgi:hypothetical protein